MCTDFLIRPLLRGGLGNLSSLLADGLGNPAYTILNLFFASLRLCVSDPSPGCRHTAVPATLLPSCLSQSPPVRRRPASHRATGPHRGAGRRRTWKWRRFSGGCFGRAGRRCCSTTSPAAASRCSATCSAPWSGCDTCSAIRWSGWSSWWRLQVDPADLMRRPRLYLKAPWTALLTRPREGPHRAGAGQRNRASANCRS